MTPEYLAGFFDGEGCITIKCERGRLFRVQAQLANTNLAVLLTAQRAFGGKLYACPGYARNYPTAKPQHVLGWYGARNVREVLTVIRPFSIVKAAEINLILDEFIPEMEAKKYINARGGRLPLSAEVIEFRSALMKRLALLKRVVAA